MLQRSPFHEISDATFGNSLEHQLNLQRQRVEQEQGHLCCREWAALSWPAPRYFQTADIKYVPPVLKELMWHCKMSFAICCFVWPIADTSTFCHLANFVLPSYSFRPVVWKRRHLIVNRALYRVIVYDFPWLLRCCSNYSWLSKLFFFKIIPFIYLLMTLSLLSHTSFFKSGNYQPFPCLWGLSQRKTTSVLQLRSQLWKTFCQDIRCWIKDLSELSRESCTGMRWAGEKILTSWFSRWKY